MSIMVSPKFFRVQTDLETNVGHISSSGLNRGTEGWSLRRLVIKPLNWMQESLDLLICMGGPRHWITCQRASHCSTMQLWAPPASPHFNINECQLLTIRHYHSARIFGAQCESQAAAPPLCENPVGEKKWHKRSSSFIINNYARFKKLLLNQRLVNWFKMSETNQE